MFEATISKAVILKKIIEAIKELVTDAKFECTASGVSLQAMDNAHVSLVALLLRSEGFETYRCDRSISLGLNLDSLAKVLKAAGSDDSVTIRAEEEADTVTFTFSSKNEKKVSTFELKLLEIEVDALGIPETEYDSVVRFPASEFQRICQNLGTWGESVLISTTKKGIKFSVEGEIGSGNVVLKQDTNADEPDQGTSIQLNKPVSLTFALQKLSAFTKATSLSVVVALSLSTDVPLSVEYAIKDMGFIRYYLAPKIEEDNA